MASMPKTPKPLPTETPEQQAAQDEAESRLAAEKLREVKAELLAAAESVPEGPTDEELAALQAEIDATNAAIEAAKPAERPDVKVIPNRSVEGSINGRKFAVVEGVEQTVTAAQADILRGAGVIS